MENDLVRTSRKTWFSVIGSAFYFICIAVFFFWIGKIGAIVGGISLLMAFIILFENIKKYRKYFLVFTTDSLSGYIDQAFMYSRQDIQAIWFTGTKDFKILHIIENNIGHDIRCNIFDYSLLDETIRKYFSPGIYSEYAYLQVPLIQEWFTAEKKKLESIDHVLTVKIRGMYIIPSLIVITFGILAILILSALRSMIFVGWSIPFDLLIIFGLVLLFVPLDKLMVTNDSIRYLHFFKQTELFWNMVTKLSKPEGGYRVVFHGKSTKINLPLSDNWFGKDKQIISEMIDIKCKDLNIPIEE